jgi:hypothetical protein
LFILITSPAFAGDSKVYTNEDLEKYKTGQEEETRQYNQKVIEYNRIKSEQYDTQNNINEIVNTYKREIEEQRIKKDRALKRIRELEEEKAKDKTETDFIGGYVGRRNAEERHKRAINREVELDNAYREAGLSRERDLQKRTEEAEKKAEKAESEARDAESEARDAENEARHAESKARHAESKARDAEWEARRRK